MAFLIGLLADAMSGTLHARPQRCETVIRSCQQRYLTRVGTQCPTTPTHEIHLAESLDGPRWTAVKSNFASRFLILIRKTTLAGIIDVAKARRGSGSDCGAVECHYLLLCESGPRQGTIHGQVHSVAIPTLAE